MDQSSSPESRASKFNWLWPHITDSESAVKASREGVWAALITAGVSTIIIVLGAITGESRLGLDPSSLIDVGILLVVAWFIRYRLNRFAVLFGMLFFIASNLALRIINLETSGILFSLALTLMWVNAVRGTFAYHRFQKARDADELQRDEPARSSMRRRIGIGLAILVTIGILGLAYLSIWVPPEGVVTWKEISPRNQQILMESGLLVDEDSVVYLYSTGLTDILENLYILTHQAVIIYETVDGERQHWVIPLESILTIKVAYSDRWDEASGLVVEDEEYLYVVPLSTYAGKDRAFISKLEELTGLTAIVIEVDASE